MTKIVGIGAGGHAKVILEILRLLSRYEVVGLLDRCEKLRNASVWGIPVLGDDSLLPTLHRRGVRHAFIGVGSVGYPAVRSALYTKATSLGFSMAPAVHPCAVVSPSVVMGNGPMIMAGAVINPDAKLGSNVIINTGAIVEHDCVIEDHVHVASGASLAGGVQVGVGSHIGLGACVREGIAIGRGVIVGAGSVVVKDLPDRVLALGVPARVVKFMTEG